MREKAEAAGTGTFRKPRSGGLTYLETKAGNGGVVIQACLLYEPGEKDCGLRQGETQRGQGRERENCNKHTDQENLDQRSITELGRGRRARETRTGEKPSRYWLSSHGIFESMISDDEKQGSKGGFGNKG